MTALALLCALLPAPRVVELPEAGPVVVVQAFVPAPPDMGDREQAAWNVLADALLDGTDEFSRDRLREFGGQAGVPLTVEAFPDFIKIQIVEPKGGLKVAGQVLESMVLRSSLTSAAIEESRNRLKLRRFGAWEQSILDFDLPYAQVTAEHVRNLYAQAFRPESMVFVFGGDILTGEGQQQVDERFKVKQEPAPRRARFDRAPRTWVKHSDPVTTFEWRGTPLSPGKVEDTTKILAVFALGVGKEGSMHRVLREGLGWTYRQEAIFWPSLKGWVPRLLFARSSADGDPAQVGTALDALKKDCESWDTSTVARAQAMLKTSLRGGNPLCPFWTDLSGPYGATLTDRCSWAGLSALMAGLAIDTTDLESKVASVTVEELKAAALKILTESQASVIPGR